MCKCFVIFCQRVKKVFFHKNLFYYILHYINVFTKLCKKKFFRNINTNICHSKRWSKLAWFELSLSDLYQKYFYYKGYFDI